MTGSSYKVSSDSPQSEIFVLRYQANTEINFDFDGDGKSDFSIFRPEVGEWWDLRSSDGGNRAFQFGIGSDKIVPADYTGDGKTDIAVYRPSTSTWWYAASSANGQPRAVRFGVSTDIAVPSAYVR